MKDFKYWWEQSMDWDSFKKMLDDLLQEGKTTGEDQSEDMLHYAKLNWQRLTRVEKTFKVAEETDTLLSSDQVKPFKVIMITEGWCGDAAQSTPVMAELARLYPDKVEVKAILRDKDTDLIDQFLTNGGRSIPKFVFLDQEFNLLGDWGPRPKESQDLYMSLREQKLPLLEMVTQLQLWYAKDKTISVQREIRELIESF